MEDTTGRITMMNNNCRRMKHKGGVPLFRADEGGRRRRFWRSSRVVVWATILLTMVIFATFIIDQQVDCKKLKLKDKKILKSLVKGLILKNLSTKKNILPMPVPIPVPIKLSKPPVYINPPPVYKPAPPPTPKPVQKPTTIVYHMHVYTPQHYDYMPHMADPSMGYYNHQMMMHQTPQVYAGSGGAYNNNDEIEKHYSQLQGSGTIGSGIKFNDFDDEFGNYYLKVNNKQQPNYENNVNHRNFILTNEIFGRRHAQDRQQVQALSKLKRADSQERETLVPVKDEETFDDENDSDAGKPHKRVKRQLYHQSSYENEEPCYGFPLEINIRSRIKPDQMFPIKGNSQFKKCIKFRPLLPPVQDEERPYY